MSTVVVAARRGAAPRRGSLFPEAPGAWEGKKPGVPWRIQRSMDFETVHQRRRRRGIAPEQVPAAAGLWRLLMGHYLETAACGPVTIWSPRLRMNHYAIRGVE